MASRKITSKLFRPWLFTTCCTKYSGFKHYKSVLSYSTDANTEPVQPEGLRLSKNCVEVCDVLQYKEIMI